MIKPIFASKIREQNKQIIREINMLLRVVAYDGRNDVKVRFKKSDKIHNRNCFILDAYLKDSHEASAIINLQHNPFSIMWFIFSKNQIKKGTGLEHCKKSRYGGYTFY